MLFTEALSNNSLLISKLKFSLVSVSCNINWYLFCLLSLIDSSMLPDGANMIDALTVSVLI
ncbi:MAG: hypothetical protein K0R54_555 [Clostridiaceae bacterium]|jgi:hypothetical protein|nr:hypothetical protein [Clostridiaceae bacterium]